MTRRRERSIVWALVLGHLLLALAYGLLNPLGEAPDEADHWAYVVHIAREHELPDIDVDLVHTGQENIISPTGIDDQESTIRAEGACKGDPSIRR